MLAKSEIYRQIDVPSTGISLLRRKIQFIAESRLRARLSLELAECYLQNGETTLARQELSDAIHYLPAGRDSQRAAFLLARIAHLNQNNERAKALWLVALKLDIRVVSLSRQIYDLLGRINTIKSL
jgi:Tfp pilus assembly protein PilF